MIISTIDCEENAHLEQRREVTEFLLNGYAQLQKWPFLYRAGFVSTDLGCYKEIHTHLHIYLDSASHEDIYLRDNR